MKMANTATEGVGQPSHTPLMEGGQRDNMHHGENGISPLT